MINLTNYYGKDQITTFLTVLESITRDKNIGKCLINDHVLEIRFNVTPKYGYDNLQKYFEEKGYKNDSQHDDK